MSPARRTLLTVAGLIAVGLAVVLLAGGKFKGPWPYLGRGAGAGGVLFVVCGAAAAARLTPTALRSVWPVFALPAGAVLGGIALTVLGFAAVPLEVSLWLVLALGIAAWVRFGRGHAPRPDWWATGAWFAALVVVAAIATLPAWRLNVTSIYGHNPDSHQVVGSAVLLQNAPAWGARAELPVDVVPSVWRSRYPILYTLAASSNLSHFDPIYVFPGLVGLLVAIACLGFAALALYAFRLPLATGPPLALVPALNALLLHVAWHPYYNQLWGFVLLPWALLFAWVAAREASRTAAIAFVALLISLGLAYPVAALYPVVTAVGLGWAYGRKRPAIPRPRGFAQHAAAVVLGLLLLVPLLAAVDKLWRGVKQLVNVNERVWGGDVVTFFGLDTFVGTDFGVLGLLVVLAVAAAAVARLLTRREGLALLALLALCVVFDVRLRLGDGQYMDFKHLGYLGAVVLVFAAAGVVAAIARGPRLLGVGAAALALGWTGLAVGNVRDQVRDEPEQVTADMLALRDWAATLPDDVSIRVDVPPSGNQLWVQYMLAEQPLGSPYPVADTTYARMPFSTSGDLVLTPRYYPSDDPDEHRPWPRPPHAIGKPVYESYSFVVRRLEMPDAPFSDRSSTTMIQP